MNIDLTKLQPGDVIFTQEHTPTSWLIRIAQGDCDWSHVCLYAGDNRIHTTGANRFILYGAVNAQKYLKNKQFTVCRYTNITSTQVKLVIQSSLSLFGNVYPLWKVLRLALHGIRGQQVKQMGILNDQGKPTNTFCSESVAYCYRIASIDLAYNGVKRENEVFTPEYLFNNPYFNTVLMHL
jgi:hypothetical protein